MRQVVSILLMGLLLIACVPTDKEPTRTLTSPTDAAFHAPDFTLTSLDGKSYTLSDLRGRWVILNFGATWCEPCRAEMPALQEISENFQGDVTLLGINLQETPAEIRPFVDELGVTFPILSTRGSTVAIDYQVVGLPQTLIIDPHGEIVWRKFGELELSAFSELLSNFIST